MEDPWSVNQAVEELLGLWWSKETDQAILQAHGREVLAQVRSIYDFAVHLPFSMGVSDEENHDRVRESLEHHFPFLSEVAIRRLVNCFAYAWK